MSSFRLQPQSSGTRQKTAIVGISRTVRKLNTVVVVGLVIASGSLFVQTWSVVTTNEWNRKKSSHDTLLDVVGIERFQELNNEFRKIVPPKDFGDRSRTYSDLMSRSDLTDEQKKEIDQTLWNILGILEALAINVNNKTLDEDIAYDYLVRYVTRYHACGKPFIDLKRKEVGEEKLFERLEGLASKWDERRKQEQKK